MVLVVSVEAKSSVRKEEPHGRVRAYTFPTDRFFPAHAPNAWYRSDSGDGDTCNSSYSVSFVRPILQERMIIASDPSWADPSWWHR